MEGFADIYDGRENIPEDIEKLAKSRSLMDTVQRTERKSQGCRILLLMSLLRRCSRTRIAIECYRLSQWYSWIFKVIPKTSAMI
jgi:hypothetical protein